MSTFLALSRHCVCIAHVHVRPKVDFGVFVCLQAASNIMFAPPLFLLFARAARLDSFLHWVRLSQPVGVKAITRTTLSTGKKMLKVIVVCSMATLAIFCHVSCAHAQNLVIADVVELSGGGASNGVNWKMGLELAQQTRSTQRVAFSGTNSRWSILTHRPTPALLAP